MRLLKSILLGFFLLLTLSAAAREQSLTLASPDGRLVAHI